MPTVGCSGDTAGGVSPALGIEDWAGSGTRVATGTGVELSALSSEARRGRCGAAGPGRTPAWYARDRSGHLTEIMFERRDPRGEPSRSAVSARTVSASRVASLSGPAGCVARRWGCRAT